MEADLFQRKGSENAANPCILLRWMVEILLATIILVKRANPVLHVQSANWLLHMSDHGPFPSFLPETYPDPHFPTPFSNQGNVRPPFTAQAGDLAYLRFTTRE